MTFFLGLHLILGCKLDVERCEDLFLVFTDIFSGNGNRKLRPLVFKFLGKPLLAKRNPLKHAIYNPTMNLKTKKSMVAAPKAYIAYEPKRKQTKLCNKTNSMTNLEKASNTCQAFETNSHLCLPRRAMSNCHQFKII